MTRSSATFFLHESTPGQLRQIAQHMGILADRGPRKGEGSVSALLDVIAQAASTLGAEYVAEYINDMLRDDVLEERHHIYNAMLDRSMRRD